MALINTLRNKLGKLIVAAVAVAIMSFVLADLLGPGSSLMGGGNDVGEIAGKTISIQEFQAEIQERENSYMLNFNRQPTDREKPTLRQQAWDLLIAKYAFSKEYDEIGIEVTDEEIWDMLQGKNLNPSLKQAFTNPETGQYDRDQFLNYLQQVPTLDANARVRWEVFKDEMIKGRERLKYEYLLTKNNFITETEAEREYHLQNDVAEVKYLYIPYYTISDSLVSVSESDLKSYYDKNKEKYEVEESRSLKYVSFEIVPSSTDSAFVKEELEQLKEEFRTTDNDSIFVSLNTDALTSFGQFNPGSLPNQLNANISNLTQGDIRGPYLDTDGYKLYKVSEIFEDSIEYARASHILIKGDDTESLNKANAILNEIKNGADFAAMAREHGTDGTSTIGGDLGWFSTGKMVAEFQEAVFKATNTGLLNNVVKTEFGYHIIKVDAVKANTAYKIATVTREILSGDETINEAFIKADLFASSIEDISSFDDLAQLDSLQIVPGNDLAVNDRRIATLGDARQIVQWLFTNASTGKISDVFELDNAYVVAVMTNEVEEGFKNLASVRAQITVELKKKAQGEAIKTKLATASGSLDEIAGMYGSDANVYTSPDLLLNSNSLPSVGFDPKAVGIAFSLEAGETSDPVLGENGVLLIFMENKTIAPDIADYSIYKSQLEQKYTNQAAYSITEAITENADITDERYKYY